MAWVGALDFSGQHKLLKHACGIDVIFTRFVDYTNEIVCFSVWVVQKGIQLPDLNGGGIAGVPQAYNKTEFFSTIGWHD